MRWSLLLLLVVACADDPSSGPGGSSRSERHEIPLGRNNQMDVLLVVDNSPMMSEQRERVRAHAAGLADVLRALPGGVPDVHIGVVSADVRLLDDAACEGTGALRINGAPVAGAFLYDRPFEADRQTNYTGDLAAALQTMVDVGSQGCATPRPFEAAKSALLNTAENGGFLRDEAYLYVVYMSSGQEYSPGEPAQVAADLKALKTDPSKVLVTAITSTASPARFTEHLAAFPNRSSSSTLDAAAPSDAFALLANLVKVTLGIPCWESPLADVDPTAPGLQPECTAQIHTATDDVVMKRCAPGLTAPCYQINEGEQACTGSNLSTLFAHVEGYRSNGAIAIIECLVEATP